MVLKESEFVEWPFFTIECRLGDYDCFVLRLAICESDCVGKIGGIDGLTIGPNVIELVPIPKPPTFLLLLLLLSLLLPHLLSP